MNTPDTETIWNGVPNPSYQNRMTVTHQLPPGILPMALESHLVVRTLSL